MSAPPTLVFIPGSWHKPTCYNEVTNLLQRQHKLKCISISLPSTAGNPAATFKDDLDAAREAISAETIHGLNVVVIAHSYGGMVGNSAIKGFTQRGFTKSQNQISATGYVIGLILIASGFTLSGLSFMDPFFGHPPPSWRVNNATGYAELVAPPRELFYHDLPENEAEFWVSQLTTQSLKALFEGGEHTYAGWINVPVWYIGTTEDRGLPVMVQRIQVGMAKAMGGNVEHRELHSSHCPFLSQPEMTVRIMVDAIETFAGKLKRNESTTCGQGDMIVAPKATILQPSTWLKFGLPLALGHIVGSCIFLFTWARRLWRFKIN
jgi:pimeloyl-ACP methyl ester carboxylesterase